MGAVLEPIKPVPPMMTIFIFGLPLYVRSFAAFARLSQVGPCARPAHWSGDAAPVTRPWRTPRSFVWPVLSPRNERSRRWTDDQEPRLTLTFPQRTLQVKGQRVRSTTDEHDHCEGRDDDLLQGLGPGTRAAYRLPSWLATERRRLGHTDAVLRREGVSRHRARPARPWPVEPGQRRSRHGPLCGRRRRGRGASRPTQFHPHWPFDWRRRSDALCRAPR